MIRNRSARAAATVLALSLCAAGALAQTPIKLPKNKYTPEQDVALGREAADEIRRKYPIIHDEKIANYLTRIGDRLAAAAPPELKQPVYEFSFTPVNLKEINAFALPGGPMFVHRGMIEASKSEGEVAGVMAHELSHVLLRHGTANATKAQNPWLQIGQIAGMVGGAVVGWAGGTAIAQSSQFGLGTLLLKYSREYEKQADLLGAQIMARAGYDPRDLAHMFETIAKQSEGGDPQWLSSHPNPGNRTEYINKEAAMLAVATPPDVSQFPSFQAAFNTQPPALTMAQLAKARTTGDGAEPSPSSSNVPPGHPGQPVPAPSSQFRAIKGGNVFQASIPSNWTTMSSKNSIRAVPENGYGDLNGQTVFTHGMEFGVAAASSRDLPQATDEFVRAVSKSNPDLRPAGSAQAFRLSERSALATPFVNTSPLGGQERVSLYTTFLSNGSLFFFLTVVPEKDASAFQDAFRHVVSSIHLIDVR